LPSCLKSLLDQTLKEIEIIAVDDASSDRTGEILDRERFEFIRHFQILLFRPIFQKSLELLFTNLQQITFTKPFKEVHPVKLLSFLYDQQLQYIIPLILLKYSL